MFTNSFFSKSVVLRGVADEPARHKSRGSDRRPGDLCQPGRCQPRTCAAPLRTSPAGPSRPLTGWVVELPPRAFAPEGKSDSRATFACPGCQLGSRARLSNSAGARRPLPAWPQPPFDKLGRRITPRAFAPEGKSDSRATFASPGCQLRSRARLSNSAGARRPLPAWPDGLCASAHQKTNSRAFAPVVRIRRVGLCQFEVYRRAFASPVPSRAPSLLRLAFAESHASPPS